MDEHVSEIPCKYLWNLQIAYNIHGIGSSATAAQFSALYIDYFVNPSAWQCLKLSAELNEIHSQICMCHKLDAKVVIPT